jgi:hypothetical protein
MMTRHVAMMLVAAPTVSLFMLVALDPANVYILCTQRNGTKRKGKKWNLLKTSGIVGDTSLFAQSHTTARALTMHNLANRARFCCGLGSCSLCPRRSFAMAHSWERHLRSEDGGVT